MSNFKPPFPWMGGKSRAAAAIWRRFGNVPNYVEPFAGSLAVMLNRPHDPKIETVNDKDCYLANFWRALSLDPGGLCKWTDWPVNEIDLHARHRWLLNQSDFRERMISDPDYYDVKIAGWWVWGLCQWIGSGWCSDDNYNGDGDKKRPRLGNAGKGICRPSQQLPHLGNAGMGVNRECDLLEYFSALSNRLRRVRVCCGDWARVLGETPTIKQGLTAVLLDPPYSADAGRTGGLYGIDDGYVAHAVREWAVANGDNPMMRIALCGYESEHAMPESWDVYRWKAHGGYGSQGDGIGRENAERETIWFSPHCLKVDRFVQMPLP